MPSPEPTTSPSVDLEAIRRNLRHLDVLSGLPGAAPQADLAAICEDLAFNHVAGLLAEVVRLQALFAEQHELHELRYIEEAVRAFERYPSNLNRQVLFARLAEVDAARLDATPQPQGDGGGVERAIGALEGMPLRCSPEEAIRRGRDGEKGLP